MASTSDNVRPFTVGEDDDGIRLDRWFKRHLPDISFNTVSRWARTGQVRVDGKRARANFRLAPGQTIRIPPGIDASPPNRSERPDVREPDARFVRSLVIHRDADVIAINKPPGLAVQGGTGTTRHLDGMLDALRFDADERPHPR